MKITVLTKGGEEVEVKTTDKTEVTSPKGELSLEKLAKYVAKVKEAGKKGAIVKVTHEGKVASKIEIVAGKKDDAVAAFQQVLAMVPKHAGATEGLAAAAK